MNVAVIVTVAADSTVVVETEKSAEIAPEETVTVAGTVTTDASSLVSMTTAPDSGAGAVSVTVPFTGSPPTTVDGLSDSEESATGGGLIVNAALFVIVPRVALMFATTEALTVDVVTDAVADALPAATVTDAGTVASA